MQIRPLRPTDIEPARALLMETGFERKAADKELFEKSISASQIVLVADEDGMVVGFARAITDGVFNGYISSVAVSPRYQRRGIGAALISQLIGHNPDITWLLRAGRPEISEFYKKLGFEVSTVAMERIRQPI